MRSPPMRRPRVRPASIGQLSSGHRDRDWLPDPQYRVPAAECGWPAATWVLGFKEITAATNVRKFIAALLPAAGCG